MREDTVKLIVYFVIFILILYVIVILVYWIMSYRKKKKRKNEEDMERLAHIFLISLFFIFVFSHFYNRNISYIEPYLKYLVPAIVPALTLVFIWHDNRKRDKQHLESISSMDKTSEIMINIEKRDNIKRNIIAAANSIYSHRNSNLEQGIKIIQGRDIASKDSNYAVTWSISYQGNSSEFQKGDSYRFQIRIKYLSSEMIDFLFQANNAMRFDKKIMSKIIDSMEDDNSPSYYELRVNRHDGHYGEVLDAGIGVLSDSPEGYRHLCSILVIIQSLDEDDLTQCNSIIDSHEARISKLRKVI